MKKEIADINSDQKKFSIKKNSFLVRKISKIYLLTFIAVFSISLSTEVFADDNIASSTDASSTPNQITPALATFSLIYTTDGNGSITGSSTQVINQGSDGSSVTATANPGFQFVKWSDNGTSSSRTDTNIQSDQNFTVDFIRTADDISTSSAPIATTTNPTSSSTATTSVVNVFIRYNDQVLFNDHFQIPTDSNQKISVTDDLGVTRDISAQSALGVLESIDAESNNFNISDLSYYSSYSEFLINCLSVNDNGTSTNACFNWQYLVNGNAPWVGIDQEILHDGDTLTLYFGQPRRLVLPTDHATSSETFTINAQNYDYINNLWNPLPNVVVGATEPNNPWSPIVIATSTTDNLGNAIFNLQEKGTYNFGLEADYYYPTYPLEIVVADSTATSTNSGGGGIPTHQIPDLEKMLNFLDANQDVNGSFGADLYTDWAAIAYGSNFGHNSQKEKLKQFIKNDSLDGSAITDYERRAMSMLSLGLNPYTDSNENYIKKITDSFDGNQIGNSSLFNDDVFGIITLISSGYNSSDDIIQKSAQFIISKQSSNGEWDNIDLTAASIQALSLAQNVPGASSAIAKGIAFLKASQVNDGGFNDPSSTSWAIQGLVAGNLDPVQVTTNNKNPFDYLSLNQLNDGSIGVTNDSLNNRIWDTSYAIPAVSEKTWPQILISVSKPTQSFGATLSSNDSTTTKAITIATTTSSSTIPLIAQISTTTKTYTNNLIYITKNNKIAKETSKNTETSSIVNTKNTDQLAGALNSGFNSSVQKALILVGSIIAGLGLLSIIFI